VHRAALARALPVKALVKPPETALTPEKSPKMALTPADADKFARICGMLGSSHDGERAAAARKATEFLQARSMTWDDFIRQLPAGPDKPERPPHWSEAPRTESEWLAALKTHCWDSP
jgi:hypothetical protein